MTLDSAQDDFRKLYEAEFTMTERTDMPWKLAKEYYERCDAHDDIVCTGRSRHGDSMPANDYERRSIMRHAAQVWKEIKDRAGAHGISIDAVHEARKEYQRHKDRRR